MTATAVPKRLRASEMPFHGLPAEDFRGLLNLGASRSMSCDCHDPLATMNASFRSVYRQACQATIERTGPVVILLGDTLTLVRGDERTSVTVTPRMFHLLKSVAHAPLTAMLIMEAYRDDFVPDEGVESIDQLRTQAMLALSQLGRYEFTAEQAARQAKVLAATVRFLDDALLAGRFERRALAAFSRELLPSIEANIAEAARLKIDALQLQMTDWRTEMTPLEWNQLRAVVAGGVMPRRECLGVQYFSHLLGVDGEGSRVVYAESAQDVDQALRLAGTHRLDHQIAVTFFNDPARMHRDLMSDATREYLTNAMRPEESFPLESR